MPRGLIIILGLAAVALVVAGAREVGHIIAPVFFGLNLVIAATPVANWLARRGCPRWLATIGAGLVALGFLVAFLYSIYWAVASFVDEMPTYSDQFEKAYEAAIARLQDFGVTTTEINKQLRTINPQSIVGFAGGALSNLTSIGSLLTVLFTVTLFMLVDSVNLPERLAIAGSSHHRFVEALSAFTDGVRRYWIVTTIFGLIVAFLNTGLLIALAVPLPLVWGVLSFITNYIPNVGFVIGVIPPTLMALLDKGNVTALIVFFGFSILNFVIQSLIQPKFTGDAVGVTTTISFVSLLFWSWVLGPLGALLALPATLLVKAVLIDADPQARWINAFIASDPATANATSPRESFGADEPDDDDPGQPG